jgi:hypothetical protein
VSEDCPRCFLCIHLQATWEEQTIGNPIYLCDLTAIRMTYYNPVEVCTLFHPVVAADDLGDPSE